MFLYFSFLFVVVLCILSFLCISRRGGKGKKKSGKVKKKNKKKNRKKGNPSTDNTSSYHSTKNEESFSTPPSADATQAEAPDNAPLIPPLQDEIQQQNAVVDDDNIPPLQDEIQPQNAVVDDDNIPLLQDEIQQQDVIPNHDDDDDTWLRPKNAGLKKKGRRKDPYKYYRHRALKIGAGIPELEREADKAERFGKFEKAAKLRAQVDTLKIRADTEHLIASHILYDYSNKDSAPNVMNLHNQRTKDGKRFVKRYIDNEAVAKGDHEMIFITGQGHHSAGPCTLSEVVGKLLHKRGIDWTPLDDNDGRLRATFVEKK